MGLRNRRFRGEVKREKKQQKSFSRISLFSCLTDPNKSQMKQEASSRATEGSSCYYALIHHCQLNLLCPAAAINLFLHISKTGTHRHQTHTQNEFKVDSHLHATHENWKRRLPTFFFSLYPCIFILHVFYHF